MSFDRGDFRILHEDTVTAHRLLHPRQNLWDRWREPSVVLTVAALVIALVVKQLGLDQAPNNLVASVRSLLWNCIVFVIPAPILFALDRRLDKASASSGRALDQAQRGAHAAKSEAMMRILGLDRPGGMLASVSQARTRALSMTGSVLGLRPDSQRPPGLGNRDNSCYQNSILQGLAALESLPGFLSACVSAVGRHDDDEHVAQSLRALLGDLNDSSNKGKTIWTPSLLKSMSTWTQQDAQEYYSKLLDDIDKAVAKAVREARRYSGLEADCGRDEAAASQHSDDSGYQSLSSSPDLSAIKPLRNPLEGLLAQRVACVQCGFSEGLSMIPFNCLTLTLGLDKSRHDLFERLDAYSRVESIEGVECHKCTLLKAQRLLKKLLERMRDAGAAEEQLHEARHRIETVEEALEDDDFDEKTLTEKCKISSQAKVSSTKTKQIVIARPPQSLAIHVNRSVFDPSTFDMIKNSAPVSFPLTLDLGPWCLGSFDGTEAGLESRAEEAEERWQPCRADASMIAGDEGASRLTGPIYELRAVVTHAGRHENGHYICYRRVAGQEGLAKQDEDVAAQEGAWWRLSDHNVSMVGEETVLGLGPGVFMLLYECVDPTMIRQSSTTASETTARADSDRSSEPTVGREDESSLGGGDVGPEMVSLPESDGETEAETDGEGQ
ncbi:hypothetical protein L249_2083 [Ophiocordyceps polyrhachis-furcata BCC 54312]|uniref:ubiquitinyl hydrolase 1 n=1 Tax=Ophiocordyceps polyrhachis-furcata BCC 54312 TaxID=1330021 RepID=A0A367LQ03_9HYPO|nr:hypothetical protein L249_2083 [Ophiocordyceps polyrhachis-furcata BCC 54312]